MGKLSGVSYVSESGIGAYYDPTWNIYIEIYGRMRAFPPFVYVYFYWWAFFYEVDKRWIIPQNLRFEPRDWNGDWLNLLRRFCVQHFKIFKFIISIQVSTFEFFLVFIVESMKKKVYQKIEVAFHELWIIFWPIWNKIENLDWFFSWKVPQFFFYSNFQLSAKTYPGFRMFWLIRKMSEQFWIILNQFKTTLKITKP